MRRLAVALLGVLGPGLLGLGACAGEDGPPRAQVFASASLMGAFYELAARFEQLHPGARLDLHFAGTPRLVLQLREGAAADVFASADEPSMQRVVELGRVTSGPVTFARNRLKIITADGNPHGIEGLADLAREDLTVLLCGPAVPAGRYARQALERAGVRVRSASDEPSVNAVVTKVMSGEADAGVVYATDAATFYMHGVAAVPIPDEHNVQASYPIAVLDAGENPARAAAFVEFVLSDEGQGILRRNGFSSP